MSELNAKFIRTFEEIVDEVNRRAGAPTSRVFEIERASYRDSTVLRNRALLIYVRDVRNALQHPKHSSKGPSVEVSESFLREVQGLLSQLLNPVTASDVGVPRRDISIARPDDSLGQLAALMKRNGFSHLPILNERGAVFGVFNEAAVFDFIWGEQETIIGRDMRLSDILSNCAIDVERTETFKFVKPGTQLDFLVGMFRSIGSAKTRLGAVFVTASGQRNEPLQRMITAWDVLAADQ